MGVSFLAVLLSYSDCCPCLPALRVRQLQIIGIPAVLLDNFQCLRATQRTHFTPFIETR